MSVLDWWVRGRFGTIWWNKRSVLHTHSCHTCLLPIGGGDGVALGVEADNAVLDEVAAAGDQGLLGADGLGA